MFENLDYLQLQQYWWIIISLLGGLFAFIMFVQGGQTLLNQLSQKDETRKTLLINSLGRKWELSFTTLVLFGGALFAAFPLFYSTSFGGAYWLWLIILFCFIIQAVSYEYRKKPNNFFGSKVYETFLFINGSVGVISLGVVISTFISGSEFLVNEYNFSFWQNNFRGLEAFTNIYNYLLAFALFFLVRIGGAMYFINNIDDEIIVKNARKSIKIDMIPFLVFFLTFLLWLFTSNGYEYNGNIIKEVPFKYLYNFLEMPIISIMFIVGVLMVIVSVFNTVVKEKDCCIKTHGVGTVITVMSIFLSLGLNNTVYYPSTFDIQSSLTIINSSGSHYTLTAMSYASLLVPFVLGYIFVAWRAMNKNKMTQKDITAPDAHNY